MRIRGGNGGWVAVEEVGLPALLYVRFVETDDRLRISELYVDGRGQPVDSTEIRHLPLDLIESVINDEAELVKQTMPVAGPDLTTLASYFSTSFGRVYRQVAQGNWVAASWAAQYLPKGAKPDTDPETGAVVARVSRARAPQDFVAAETEFRLQEGPVAGLTDEFLSSVARAYRAATLRGERPNVAISEQTGYPLKTVQRWVYTARQRGVMPKGKKGKAS